MATGKLSKEDMGLAWRIEKQVMAEILNLLERKHPIRKLAKKTARKALRAKKKPTKKATKRIARKTARKVVRKTAARIVKKGRS